MHTSRLVSMTLTAALGLSIVPSAFAMTPGEVLEMQQTYQVEDLCEGKEDRERGRCISDTLRRIKALRKLFSDSLKEDRKLWDAEHAELGVVSAEYMKELQAYGITMQARRKLFNEQQRIIEKTFFDKQKEVRITQVQEKRPESQHMSTSTLKEAAAKCSSRRNEKTIRVCLRQQMRMANPNMRNPTAGFKRL